MTGVPDLPFRALAGISLVGGVLGALLLLATPASFFARLVPWLVLFATAVFAWGSFRRPPAAGRSLGRWPAAVMQFLISIYGGYFGGGIGFLMLAALTAAGLPVRNAGATKNVLAGVMNAAAVVVFLFSAGRGVAAGGRGGGGGDRRRAAGRLGAAPGERAGVAGRRGGHRRAADDRAVRCQAS